MTDPKLHEVKYEVTITYSVGIDGATLAETAPREGDIRRWIEEQSLAENWQEFDVDVEELGAS